MHYGNEDITAGPSYAPSLPTPQVEETGGASKAAATGGTKPLQDTLETQSVQKSAFVTKEQVGNPDGPVLFPPLLPPRAGGGLDMSWFNTPAFSAQWAAMIARQVVSQLDNMDTNTKAAVAFTVAYLAVVAHEAEMTKQTGMITAAGEAAQAGVAVLQIAPLAASARQMGKTHEEAERQVQGKIDEAQTKVSDRNANYELAKKESNKSDADLDAEIADLKARENPPVRADDGAGTGTGEPAEDVVVRREGLDQTQQSRLRELEQMKAARQEMTPQVKAEHEENMKDLEHLQRTKQDKIDHIERTINLRNTKYEEMAKNTLTALGHSAQAATKGSEALSQANIILMRALSEILKKGADNALQKSMEQGRSASEGLQLLRQVWEAIAGRTGWAIGG